MRGVNLIPTYRIHARLRADRTRIWVISCGAYLAVLVLGWSASQFIWPDRRVAIASDVIELAERTKEDKVAAQALYPRLVQARSTLAATQSIGDEPDWSHLVVLTAQLLGEDAVLRSCRLEPASPVSPTDAARISRYTLQLEGYGRSQAAVLAYVRALEETRLFLRVTLLETRGEAFHDGQAIAFRIQCMLADGGPGGAS